MGTSIGVPATSAPDAERSSPISLRNFQSLFHQDAARATAGSSATTAISLAARRIAISPLWGISQGIPSLLIIRVILLLQRDTRFFARRGFIGLRPAGASSTRC